jgi:hypothetical protein
VLAVLRNVRRCLKARCFAAISWKPLLGKQRNLKVINGRPLPQTSAAIGPRLSDRGTGPWWGRRGGGWTDKGRPFSDAHSTRTASIAVERAVEASIYNFEFEQKRRCQLS